MIDSSDDDQFVGLHQLIKPFGAYSVGVLATAIEDRGIYTWDRFGRFRKFGPVKHGDPEPKEITNILNMLAGVHEYEQEVGSPGFDRQHPVDAWPEHFGVYGWLREDLPDFDAIQRGTGASPPKPIKSGWMPSDRKIIEVLALVLADRYPPNQMPTAKDLERCADLQGIKISDDTIRAALNAAREILGASSA